MTEEDDDIGSIISLKKIVNFSHYQEIQLSQSSLKIIKKWTLLANMKHIARKKTQTDN